ncbi:MAG: hypothetical protein K6A65_01255 [Succinivibrionaceae bacterium]|nr:hypothetical protein [Succinivibrionaceae bacterium]
MPSLFPARWLLAALAALTLCGAPLAQPAPHLPDQGAAARPTGCALGQRLRVAVAEDGPYGHYDAIFRYTLSALDRYGLARIPRVPSNVSIDDRDIVLWLTSKLSERGPGCVTFAPDRFYNAGWREEGYRAVRDAIYERANKRGDLDLVLVFGDRLARELAHDDLSAKVLVLTSFNPEQTGLVGPGEFSDRRNVLVRKNPDNVETALKIYQRLTRFERLGVILDSHERNQAMVGADKIRHFAAGAGVRLEECPANYMTGDTKANLAEFRRCVGILAQSGVDAVYLTANSSLPQPRYWTDELNPLVQGNIPFFSQGGLRDVRHGMLMGVGYDTESDLMGDFVARTVRAIIAGVPVGQISQYFHSPMLLALNLQTAALLNYQPSFESLGASDRIYYVTERGDQ